MPIYEFYCPDCHVVYSFLARSGPTSKRPSCPRCGRQRLNRRVSSFAVSRGRSEPSPEASPPEVDDARMERAVEELAREAEDLAEDDTQAVAHLMRKLYDASGLRFGPAMEEALRRMEAGEDPDRIEEEMGDLLEQEDPLSGEGVPKPGRQRRRLGPPAVDATLHEL